MGFFFLAYGKWTKLPCREIVTEGIMEQLKRKFIGDRKFYAMVLAVAVPIMLQNGLTNVVSLLDNLMVGRVGTDQMSGVSIVNQLIFIVYLSLFGGMAGAGIFTAQYFGKKDEKGVQDIFRIKIVIGMVLAAIGIFVLWFWSEPLIGMFLHEGDASLSVDATMLYAKQYLGIMLIGLVPFALSQCVASTLRECSQTVSPMIASVAAVFVDLVFNYILIFGKFGAPALGVRGAAVATVMSRFVECAFLLIWTWKHRAQYSFITGLFSRKPIAGILWKQSISKGMPLLINEFLWSLGVTMQAQCYSTRGLEVVAGLNICNTLNNVFNIAFLAMGNAVAIIIGQMLGAGKMEEAKDTDTKLIFFSVVMCIGIGALMALAAPFFPLTYNTTPAVQQLATSFLLVMAFMMPFCSFTNASYFTLRSGGCTGITFLFDSMYMWCLVVPLAFVLSRFTDIEVVPLYMLVQGTELIKALIGYALVKKGVWLRNLVAEEE